MVTALMDLTEAVTPILDFLLKFISIFGMAAEGPFLLDYHAPPYTRTLFNICLGGAGVAGVLLVWLAWAEGKEAGAVSAPLHPPSENQPLWAEREGPPPDLSGRPRSAEWPYEYLDTEQK